MFMGTVLTRVLRIKVRLKPTHLSPTGKSIFNFWAHRKRKLYVFETYFFLKTGIYPVVRCNVVTCL
jgi:hypothetical protein